MSKNGYGARLAEARKARDLSVDEVARILLLSGAQVRDLEQESERAFYTPWFYRQALRKYALLLGVALDELHVASETPADDAPAGTTISPPQTAIGWPGDPRPIVTLGPVVIATILATVGTGALWLHSQPTTSNGPAGVQTTPPGPLHTLSDASAPLVTGPTASRARTAERQTTPSEVRATEFARLRVSKDAWVFVRSKDGSLLEQTVLAGAVVVLRDQPTYLAVGTTSVRLEINGEDVDVSRWFVNGQLRMGREEFLKSADLKTPSGWLTPE